MNKNAITAIKWIGFIVYALAFIDSQAWYDFTFITSPVDIYMMIGAAVLAFAFANPMKWLGLAIFLFGIALKYEFVSLNLESISFDPLWLMLSGYLMLFFNSK